MNTQSPGRKEEAFHTGYTCEEWIGFNLERTGQEGEKHG
jgi:hypothetical protein